MPHFTHKRFYKNALLCLLFLCIGLSSRLSAQLGMNIIEGPIHVMPCDSACIMLHAVYPKQQKRSQYAISAIPFNPINITGSVLSLPDDKFSGSIPLGFNFCFFEQTYSSCYISDNGILTFNNLYANASCFNNTQQTLPYYNSTCPDNAIFGLFMDLAPNQGGSIRYTTTGTSPFRKFIVSYQGLKLFGSNCTPNSSTFQIVLNETTNIIEVFITNKDVCNNQASNTTNFATVGIQNQGATNTVTAPGKHASIFTSSNEGIRIAPAGPINSVMTWKNHSGVVIGSNSDSIYFCPPFYPYSKTTATITYTCPPGTYTDTVRFTKITPVIQNLNIVQPPCVGFFGSIALTGTGTVGPYTYAINNGAYSSSNQFNNLNPGNYTISIKDANGCKKDTLISLAPLVNIQVIVDAIINPTCPINNGSIQVHAVGGTSPYTYLWDNGTTGPNINNCGPGTYQITVTDANGCTAIAYVNAVWQGLPDVIGAKLNPLCGTANGSISLTVTGANPPYSYTWTPASSISSNLTNLSAGIYSVTVTDQVGCSTSKIYQLVDTLSITLPKMVQHTKCGLSNGQINLIPFGGLAPYTYSWSPSGQTTALAINLSSGVHIVTVTAANGCTKTDTTMIQASLATSNQITFANANCDLDNGLINLNSVTNSTGTVTKIWSNGTIGVNAISNLAPGIYWVQTTDIIGCIDIDTIHLLNDGRPQLNIVNYAEPKCYGDSTGSVLLSGSAGVAPYKYSLDGINFSSIAQLNNIPGGTYPIYITDANSCPNDTLVTFGQPSEIQLNYISDTVACYSDSNASLQLFASDGISPYLYSINQDSLSTKQVFENLSGGVYTVTIKDANDCMITTIANVAIPALPLKINVTENDIPCFENSKGSFEVEIEGGWEPYNYTWSTPNFIGLEYDNLGVIHESIAVEDARGCKQNAQVNIEQLLCCKAVIPSAFSPNGDNLNKELRILPISEISKVDLKIFNRYGQVVFATNDVNKKWDGTFKNQPCDVGTYFYWFTYNCLFQNKRVEEKGDITLIR